LIEFYQSLFKPKPKVDLKVDFTLVEVLKGFVYELTFKHGNKSTKKEPSMYVELFKRILTNINADYDAGKIADKKFPDLSVLFTFKLVSTVFPVSDFRHQISTPCLLIMTRYLTECATQTVGDCLRGSFLCNLCFEFISLSKRFIPECIQYLNGVLYLSIDWKKEEHLKQYDLSTIYESFKKSQLKLLVSKKLDKLGQVNLIQTSSNEASQMSDSSLSASLIAYNLDLILAFAKIYDGHVSYREVFHLTNVLLNLLPKQSYPAELTDRIQKLQLTIAASTQQPREFLKCLIKKPFATKMIDPRVQTKSKFDPKHHNSVISEKQLDARKYKKEMKSAIKEIRQDNQYLARVQLQEQLEKDKKRSAKVKEIMGSLASQEGEYQKAKRMKS
jgi:nucleolar protein 14